MFLNTVAASATSANAGTITYGTSTGTVCTVNASTGSVALTGLAAGNTCTVTATSSLDGSTPGVKASASRNIAITTRVEPAAANSCALSVPRASDAVVQTAEGMNNSDNTPRSLGGTSAPNNPDIRTVNTVTSTYNYAAGVGAATKLTTTATGGSDGTKWLGYVPLPIPAALMNKPSNAMKEEYDIDAAGNITTTNYWQPQMASKPGLTDTRTAVEEIYPADWQNTFAKRVTASTPANTVLGAAIPVTERTLGGWLNGYQYKQSGGGMNGVTYKNAYYNVTATYKGRSATEKLSAVFGKLEYTNMCEIQYTFTRRTSTGSVSSGGGILPDGPADPGADPSLAAYSNWVWTANIATSPAKLGFITVKSAASIAAGGTDSLGDWSGTFYSHTALPRVFKDSKAAITTAAGGPAVPGDGTTAHGNSAYYENRDGSGTNHTYMNWITTGITRAAYP